MSQVVTAIYENGVFRPSEPLDLPTDARVRLTIDLVEDRDHKNGQRDRLAALEDLWRNSKIDSHGERLTRDQLHERG